MAASVGPCRAAASFCPGQKASKMRSPCLSLPVAWHGAVPEWDWGAWGCGVRGQPRGSPCPGIFWFKSRGAAATQTELRSRLGWLHHNSYKVLSAVLWPSSVCSQCWQLQQELPAQVLQPLRSRGTAPARRSPTPGLRRGQQHPAVPYQQGNSGSAPTSTLLKNLPSGTH